MPTPTTKPQQTLAHNTYTQTHTRTYLEGSPLQAAPEDEDGSHGSPSAEAQVCGDGP